jgi:hypothetical protein
MGETMKRWMLVLILCGLTAVVAACGTQGASGGGGKSDEVVLNGCRVDPARICDAARNQPVQMSGTGLEADPNSRMVEQNSARTANIFIPVKNPKGYEIFEVECGINTLNHSVSWAHVKTGPPVTDDDAKYLRASNYCSEP